MNARLTAETLTDQERLHRAAAVLRRHRRIRTGAAVSARLGLVAFVFFVVLRSALQLAQNTTQRGPGSLRSGTSSGPANSDRSEAALAIIGSGGAGVAVVLLIQASNRRRHAVAEILRIEDVDAIGPLAELLWARPANIRRGAARSLARLLPRLTAHSRDLLDDDQHLCLNRALLHGRLGLAREIFWPGNR